MSEFKHEPVLVSEVIDALNINPNGIYLDATFGRGGHSGEILKRLGPLGRLIGIDKDQAAIDYANQTLGDEPRFSICKSSFDELNEILPETLGNKKLDGAFFDFGVSSPQLDDPQRGFSFRHDGPLDMRMDQQSNLTAKSWLQSAEEYELRTVFKRYGEERFAGRIARKIISVRDEAPLETTNQLASLVVSVVPTKERDKHPATRVFQAIRIRVNKELEEISNVLPVIIDWLKPEARLVVISFHSLEDRIVKRFMRSESIGDNYPYDLPITADMLNPSLKIITKAARPQPREVYENPRSRSAVLRVAEKLEQRL